MADCTVDISREFLYNRRMISTAAFRTIVFELMDELPDEFFRELSGGVIVSEAASVPGYAKGDDLYTMGVYRIYSGVRQITLFKGSFDRVYPNADETQAKEILRGVLRHEIRHHLESLGGVQDDSSLEAEDARKKQAYLARHAAGEQPKTE